MNAFGEDESLRVPAGLAAQVRAAAEEEQRPSSEILRDALERYLTERQWEKLYAYGQGRAQALDLSDDDVDRLIADYRAEHKAR
jgi:hypothetical protein